MNAIDSLIFVRGAVESDFGCIIRRWEDSVRYSSDWFKDIDPDFFFEHYRKLIEGHLRNPDMIIKIACLKDDPDVIIGFAVYEPITAFEPKNYNLHFMYVKEIWRDNKIATMITPSTITHCSNMTRIGLTIHKKYPYIKFQPEFMKG